LEKLKGRGCGFVALEIGATADHPTHDRFLVGLGSAANYVMSRDWLTLFWALLISCGEHFGYLAFFLMK
jgi:hypothetical protein